ncbi:hypothetical protein [Deinococcus arenicola]|uniref:Uncharacterized protein n=1 Tax=Deinococcus arenicola TaxID=2994950 RepID=A0ABU4DQ76_9DEIO|nr:hypothetical protein [Deinococcus sp. ZS9-10]MDV6374583.1 hypothetical protein [Deinococcus sp. ZS9-10]
MLALAVVICESGPLESAPPDAEPDGRKQEQGEGHYHDSQLSAWQAEARFMIANADELFGLLTVAGVSGRLHPPQLSTQVSADLLFEDGDIIGETWLIRPDLAQMWPHAASELRELISAWDAFARALENAGRATRLIVWFIR